MRKCWRIYVTSDYWHGVAYSYDRKVVLELEKRMHAKDKVYIAFVRKPLFKKALTFEQIKNSTFGYAWLNSTRKHEKWER